ncbi:MAG: PCRF domain-containing protein, partial [Chloroflexi bacterium]|nr:PCRF domain-containing protein [Chloroflexota bacterium]
MWDKLGSIRARHEDLAAEMARPEVVTDYERVETLAREHTALGKIVRIADEYRDVEATLAQARQIVAEGGDEDFIALAREDIATNEKRATELEQELRVALIPKDPFDEKSVIVEIRGAAGGEEAKLFTADLFRMYSRYAERQGWKTEVLEAHGSDIGGFKEIVFAVHGDGAYSRL